MSKNIDPGLGTNFSKRVNRFMNPNGSYNVTRSGTSSRLFDIYSWCIHTSSRKLILVILIFYILINLFFGTIYFLFDSSQFQGMNHNIHPFLECYFFSVHTFTTVGYGLIAPIGFGANIVTMFEALIGFMSFSIATGIVYGRFSRPNVKIRFTENIIIAPFENGKAMMFKIQSLRSQILMKCKVRVILILDHADGTKDRFNKDYHTLKLETDSINFFPLTWTVVHKIDEISPLNSLSVETIEARSGEVIVLFEAYDETFNQNIIRKHSFAGKQWLDNVKFKRNFDILESGIIDLRLDEIDEYEEVK